MIRIALRIAAACCGAIAVVCAQQGDDLVVRVRSLLPFHTPSLQHAEPRCSALPTDRDTERPDRLDAPAESASFAWVRDLIAQRHAAAIEAGRLALSDVGDEGATLVLRGRAAAVAACEQELDAIAAALGRPIEVSAFMLPLGDGELPPTTWDAAALKHALERTPPTWTARGRTRSGGALRLANERGIAHLHDYNVEVAERAQINDPQVDIAFAGVRATLVVDALAGDELVLRGSWLLSEPVAMHEVAVGTGQPTLDLPEHRTTWVTFAGRVVTGGAVVVSGRGGPVAGGAGGQAGFALVLAARFLAPPAGDPAPGLLVRPIGAWLPRPAIVPRLAWARLGDDGDGFVREEPDGGITAGSLTALLGVSADVHGGMLIVEGDPDGCRAADAQLQMLARELRPIALRTRVLSDGGEPLELVVPMLADRAAGAFVGRERAVIRDQDVEIASRAQMGNPSVTVAYSGLWLSATAGDVGQGWHVAGLWSLAAHAEPRLREVKDKPPMALTLVDYRTTALPWDALMPANQEHALGDGPAWIAGGPATKVSVVLIAP